MGRKVAKAVEAAVAALNAELNSETAHELDDAAARDMRPSAMGKGEEKLFEKKLTKEEKKTLMAAKKADRDARKKGDLGPAEGEGEEDGEEGAGGEGGKGKDGDTLRADALAPPPELDPAHFFAKSGEAAEHRTTQSLDVLIGGIQLYAGKTELIANGVLQLVYGTKYALIGRNGVGKSSLLRALSSGAVKLPSFIHVVHVEQEIAGGEETALQAVMSADKEREWLLGKERELSAEDALEREGDISLQEVYERLDELDSDNAEARAATLLAGLGFDTDMQSKPTRSYSGGWRMRIALAQPTNHLDVHALTWLQHFLCTWEKTVLIVSHDRGFLNHTTTKTIHVHLSHR
ncbi:P-loop containing nucleoside triphosphate hydrolase protein [Pavlovales sp. CCMP2436]|nr:P-loop containing nucleoside triphosphate hydrolase protein [Pavlovales sp. CCMP2436]